MRLLSVQIFILFLLGLYCEPAHAWSTRAFPNRIAPTQSPVPSRKSTPVNSAEEDQWFDRSYMPITELTRKMYDEGRVLFFGSANHNNYAI